MHIFQKQTSKGRPKAQFFFEASPKNITKIMIQYIAVGDGGVWCNILVTCIMKTDNASPGLCRAMLRIFAKS